MLSRFLSTNIPIDTQKMVQDTYFRGPGLTVSQSKYQRTFDDVTLMYGPVLWCTLFQIISNPMHSHIKEDDVLDFAIETLYKEHYLYTGEALERVSVVHIESVMSLVGECWKKCLVDWDVQYMRDILVHINQKEFSIDELYSSDDSLLYLSLDYAWGFETLLTSLGEGRSDPIPLTTFWSNELMLIQALLMKNQEVFKERSLQAGKLRRNYRRWSL